MPILGTGIYARRVPEVDTAPPGIEETGAGLEPTVAATPADPVKFRYHGSLDGLRALAVLAIIAYHFNYGWARGAYLSVDLFFILSGFLITTLLIMEWRRTGRIALRAFWGRRARRLLPALLIVLVFVAVITVTAIAPWNRAAIRDDGIASLFYVANWRFIAAKQGYFELFSAASPLRHMWSLAIEEQFYLVWPLVAYAALRAARGLAARARRGVRRRDHRVDRGDGDHVPPGRSSARVLRHRRPRAHASSWARCSRSCSSCGRPGATAKRRLRTVVGDRAFVVMIVRVARRDRARARATTTAARSRTPRSRAS